MELYLGDCLEVMDKLIEENVKVDAIITDPPYGTTACKWDSVIPLEPMWERLNKLIKLNGAIVLNASQPFTTTLISSNMKMFKYCWIWDKIRATNFFAAKFVPLNNTEDIVVFSTGGCNNGTKNPVPYYPQGLKNTHKKNKYGGGKVGKAHGAVEKKYIQKTTGYPYKTIQISFEQNTVHPTQKPVALMEYLIKTYANENETVLDFTMGSGTTGIACKNLNRNFIGIELNEEYFEIAKKRIEEHIKVT